MLVFGPIICYFQLSVAGNSKHKLLSFPHQHFQLFGVGTFLQNAGTNDRMFQYLDIGITDFERLITLFQEDKKQAPTQLKLVYDNVNKKAKAQYSYDLFHSNSDTLTPYDIFMEWYNEVKKEIEGNHDI